MSRFFSIASAGGLDEVQDDFSEHVTKIKERLEDDDMSGLTWDEAGYLSTGLISYSRRIEEICAPFPPAAGEIPKSRPDYGLPAPLAIVRRMARLEVEPTRKFTHYGDLADVAIRLGRRVHRVGLVHLQLRVGEGRTADDRNAARVRLGERRHVGTRSHRTPAVEQHQRYVDPRRMAESQDAWPRKLNAWGWKMLVSLIWSPLFFGAHQVFWSLIVLAVIFVLASVTTLIFARIRRGAAWLMVPYLAWLCFTALLTWQIAILNPGAETIVPSSSSAQIAI